MKQIVRPAHPIDPDYFQKHTPGGHDHDQKTHGHGGGGSDKPAGGKRKWVDHYPGLPKDTKTHHSKNGEYTAERKELHEKIIDKFNKDVKPVPENQTPVAIIMMGGSGAGKGGIRQEVAKDKDIVIVDSDDVKDEIPEFQMATSDPTQTARDAAFMVHPESGDVAWQLRERAIAERKNVLIDGTGKDLNDYSQTMAKLRERGYEVTLIMADVDVETAWERVQVRAETKGRLVPENVVRDIYGKVPYNFSPLSSRARHAYLFDTRGKSPRLVYSKVSGKETDHDSQFMSVFRGKYGNRT